MVTMTAPILHHYPASPFAEKVRLVLGSKGLAWRSVIVPAILPKPDVVALTGGYRRTPVMQVGADVYCDTALICKVIDRLAPDPPLYPAATQGLAEIVAQWADASLFWIAVPFTMQPMSVPHMFPDATPESLQAFVKDRAAMTPNLRRATIPDGGAQLQGYLGRLENLLGDGRRFLLGAGSSIADFAVAHSIWYMCRSPPIGAMVDAFPKVLAWHGRMKAFGHGTPTEIGSDEAIAIAASGVTAPTAVDPGGGLDAGEPITVTPTDYACDPVGGKLVGLARDEVVLERVDERAGRVHVHFPRVGFQIKKAAP
jgi:glutathione S-transferase